MGFEISNNGGRNSTGGSMAIVHAALALTQLGFAGAIILSRVALSSGVNAIVFAIYRDIVALTFLVPFAYFTERNVRGPHLTLATTALLLLLGAFGVFGGQYLFLSGIALTSASYAAAFQILIPVNAFAIAIVFRVENIRLNRRDGQAKTLGILFCVLGILIISSYKGPAVLGATLPPVRPSSEMYQYGYLISVASKFGLDNWQIGTLALIANSLCFGIYINLTVPTLKRFPAPVSMTAFSYFFGAIMLASAGFLTIKNPDDWVISRKLDIISVVYAGLVPSAINFAVQAWCTQKAGMLLVAGYIPLLGVTSSTLGFLLLKETFFLGNALGGAVIVAGLYCVTWGQRASTRLASQPVTATVGPDGQLVVKPVSSIQEPLLG